jgi:hypothetical protein
LIKRKPLTWLRRTVPNILRNFFFFFCFTRCICFAHERRGYTVKFFRKRSK